MNKKQRLGVVEKRILDILNWKMKNRNYVEISLRKLAINMKDKKYNSVRNAVDRLEKYGIIQTIIVPVYGHSVFYFNDKKPSKLRMIRLYADDREWQCINGIRFFEKYILEHHLSCCKI